MNKTKERSELAALDVLLLYRYKSVKKFQARFEFVYIQVNEREEKAVVQKQTDIEHKQECNQKQRAHLRKFLHKRLHVEQKAQDKVHDDDRDVEYK